MKQIIVVLGVLFSLNANSVAKAEDANPPVNEDGDVRATFLAVDIDFVLREESQLPELELMFSKPLAPKSVGAIVAFGRLAADRAELYAGPGLFVGPLTIGVGVGVEAHQDVFRAGALAMLDTEKITAHAVADTGGSGLWWKAEGLWHPRKWIGFGAMAERGDGFGPRVEIIPLGRILSLHYGLMRPNWSKPGYTTLIGIRLQTD